MGGLGNYNAAASANTDIWLSRQAPPQVSMLLQCIKVSRYQVCQVRSVTCSETLGRSWAAWATTTQLPAPTRTSGYHARHHPRSVLCRSAPEHKQGATWIPKLLMSGLGNYNAAASANTDIWLSRQAPPQVSPVLHSIVRKTTCSRILARSWAAWAATTQRQCQHGHLAVVLGPRPVPCIYTSTDAAQLPVVTCICSRTLGRSWAAWATTMQLPVPIQTSACHARHPPGQSHAVRATCPTKLGGCGSQITPEFSAAIC